MSDFGEFLYTLRKEKGITQAELAEILGVTNKAVSKWETGESMPETSLLLPLSRVFGVTVDELLNGERVVRNSEEEKDGADISKHREDVGEAVPDSDSAKDYDNKREFVRVKHGKTVVTVVADNLDDLDGLDDIDINRHIFKKDKDNKQTLIDKIWGAVFASLALIGVIVYVLIGTFTDVWHPYWVIIPCFILSSGLVGSVLDMCNSAKREDKIKRGENPYTGGICGIIMLTCIIVYLLIGAFVGRWHPCWAIPAGGAVVCGIVGAIGDAIAYRHKNKK